jgi:hypothetical protein
MQPVAAKYCTVQYPYTHTTSTLDHTPTAKMNWMGKLAGYLPHYAACDNHHAVKL